ncbi:MAG: alpha/beta family hydrolase [Polyangiaceae bacterium]
MSAALVERGRDHAVPTSRVPRCERSSRTRRRSSRPPTAQRSRRAAPRGSKPCAWIIGGKSMGGRMASHLAAQGEPIDALLLLGYPLHPALKRPGDEPKKLRVDHLGAIRVPSLFLSGTKDPLCDLDRLRAALAPLGGHVELIVLEGADHSLARPVRAFGPRADQIAEIATLVDRWIEKVIATVTLHS